MDSDQTLFEGNPNKKLVIVKKEEEGEEDGGAQEEAQAEGSQADGNEK